MTHYTTLSSNLKRAVLSFSERISTGLTRPEFKFISQMIYGMLCSQSCLLSEVARALNEPVLLKKTIERLSVRLRVFSKGELLFSNYIKKVKQSVSNKTILIIDDSDIAKPYSLKMEGLRDVYDGSTGKIVAGYPMIDVTALTPEYKLPIPIYSRVYSAGEAEFISAEDESLKALAFLRANFKRNNIRALDRGFDNNLYYKEFINHKEKFIIRAKVNRNVIYDGETINILKLAERYKGRYKLEFRKRNGKKVDCRISIVPICLPCRPNEELNLIICRDLGEIPMLLITNLKSDDNRIAVTVVKVYLMRWRIEEFHRFKKQQFKFEGFRVRSLNAIRNLDTLLNITVGYIGMMSERADDKRIVMELIFISKRIYGVSKFKFYAIADGIHAVLTKGKTGISSLLLKKRRCGQLCLFPEAFLSTA